MENLSKTLAEVKSALDQATQMLDENETLREELKTLKGLYKSRTQNESGTTPQRELKVIEMAYQAGREAVIGQLRFTRYETTHDVEESTYSDGFEVQFSKEVDIEIEVDAVLDGHLHKTP